MPVLLRSVPLRRGQFGLLISGVDSRRTPEPGSPPPRPPVSSSASATTPASPSASSSGRSTAASAATTPSPTPPPFTPSPAPAYAPPPSPSSQPEALLRSLARTYTAGDSAPFVFGLLVRACLHSGKVDAAAEIVRRLRRRRISPAVPTADLLIKTVCKVKGTDAGMAIFREIFGEDCERLKLSPPNAYIFNRLLLSCYREEMADKLEETKIKMCELGCNLNLYSYCILMAAAIDQSKMGDAMNLWEDMKRKQIAPDAMAYNTLIRGFCEGGKVERGEEHVREMVMGGMEPTCLTYEHLIRGHC